MDNDIDIIRIKFRKSSTTIYISVFEAFQTSIRALDRQKDENVFQQLQGKYLHELKRQLTDAAMHYLSQFHDKGNPENLRGALTNEIAHYINEFLHKTRSL